MWARQKCRVRAVSVSVCSVAFIWSEAASASTRSALLTIFARAVEDVRLGTRILASNEPPPTGGSHVLGAPTFFRAEERNPVGKRQVP